MARTFGGASTDKVTVANHAALNSLATLSFAIWAYRTGNGGGSQGRLFDKNDGWSVRSSTSGYEFAARRWTTAAGLWRIARPTTDVWAHVGVTYDYGSAENDPAMYLDGVAQAVTQVTQPTGAATVADTADSHIGNSLDNTRNWAGRLAEAAIWNRVLSAAEMAALGAGASPLCFPRGLISYVPMVRDILDRMTAATVTVSGTVAVQHPRILVPVGGVVALAAAAGGPTTHQGAATIAAVSTVTAAATVTYAGAAVVAAVSTVTASAVSGAPSEITVSWTEPVFEFTTLVETWVEESADGNTWTLVAGSEKPASAPGGGGGQSHAFTPEAATAFIRIGAREAVTGNVSYSDPVAVEGGATIHLGAASSAAVSTVTAAATVTYAGAATIAAISTMTARAQGGSVIFSAGVVPIKVATDPTAPGVVPVFVAPAGPGVVPTRVVAAFEAGVVPVRLEDAPGVGIVPVSDVDA